MYKHFRDANKTLKNINKTNLKKIIMEDLI